MNSGSNARGLARAATPRLICMTLVVASTACGCAGVSPDAALGVADRYYAALAASDPEGACALMTDSQRRSFEGGTCVEVMRFLLETDGAPDSFRIDGIARQESLAVD